MNQQPQQPQPQTKKLVIIRGRGDSRRPSTDEQRIETDTTMYWCQSIGRWVTVPEDED